MPDITGNIDYYRQYLDDSLVIVSSLPPVVSTGPTPTSDDIVYLRRYLDDIS